MAASVGDLIQFVDKQSYLGEELMNVYYYRVTSLTGLAGAYLDALADWFKAEVIGPVRFLQNNLLTHTELDVRNLSNNIDLHTEVVNLAGENTGTSTTALPSFVTVNFKLVRESLATRNGSKRYSGLLEIYQNGNSYEPGGSIMANIEAALAKDIVLGVVTVAEPVIVRRPIVPPVGPTYVYASIGSALYTNFGTQNTRKP